MARSRKIGHCVCDPRKPCPCPLFTEKNVCTCAGEREAVPGASPIRLTEHVRSAGCAGKIGPRVLQEVLRSLPAVRDPRLLVGMDTGDDAGVFRITDDATLVQTVDVFTPTVDDPRIFGRIAACNSVSDVYAMGGRPLTALSIIGFPVHRLPPGVMEDILRGGMETLQEAGAVLLGGHSLEDEEITFGFAVTGLVDPARIVTNAGARPGDLLVLTKPLGTGIVSLARQVGKAAPESVHAAERSMAKLNRAASEIMIRRGATACTDVTGFGLLVHLYRIATESRVTVEVQFPALPLLPGALNYAGQGFYSGANERNADYVTEVEFDGDVGEAEKAVLFDPQTSGGLLMTLAADAAGKAVEEMLRAGVDARVIGSVAGRSDGRILVRGNAVPAGAPRGAGHRERLEKESVPMKEAENGCCEGSHGVAESSIARFQDFMGSAMRPGAVDVVTKELIAVALGLAVHCAPCARTHIGKARQMGISAGEIEEAAALAVAFSGCRALMLWNELKKEMPTDPPAR